LIHGPLSERTFDFIGVFIAFIIRCGVRAGSSTQTLGTVAPAEATTEAGITEAGDDARTWSKIGDVS